ncbi:ComEC/Rec2 family competence protein [Aquihabitans sp. G128]|uniref:ComEC/Rec2 family competence protein n=1 Tax=Aquihabitans sp. G128 TaxID=2849779 RepID=UPI001C217C29|nr:ComEC/Rec2 family competence protein [Aquihabitans sp. G128]QXC61544.1 ComEC/Rec2 family competence protein [Aquihabitans sp. G128]
MSAPTERPPAVASGLPPAPAAPPRQLTDRGAVALAVAVALGAWWSRPLPLLPCAFVVVASLLARRPWLLVLGGLVLASSLGARSMAGLDPVEAGPYEGRVTLLADPTPTPFGTRVDVRVGQQRLELQAEGAAAGSVGSALAGERLLVTGRLRPPPPRSPWLVPRHVVGRLAVEHAERVDGGSAPWQAANRFRRLLGRGAEVLPETARSLYGGFVLGDDRDQRPEVVDDFRGAGLTHLLVVSGQNLAFVLVLLSPVTNRLGLRWRWVVTLGVIGAFGVVTRFEPSVLRASAMAALAVSASTAGRPAASLRILALAVSGLLLVDPLLVRSVGFELSVGASAGIAVLAAPIEAHLRGPAWLREALAVTIAAQLGVAPVLVPRFGGVPVVSIVANVLAVPVAGLVTTWGLPAGVVAGLLGPNVARVVHLPTQLAIWWVAAVARVSASLPLGEVGGEGLLVIVTAGAVAVRLGRRRPTWHWPRRAATAVVLAALLAPAVALRHPPPQQQAAGLTIVRQQGTTVVVLSGRVSPADAMEALRLAGVRRIDLLQAPSEPDPDLLRALRHRWPVTHIQVLEPTDEPTDGPAP